MRKGGRAVVKATPPPFAAGTALSPALSLFVQAQLGCAADGVR